jgi:hypothetical protein
MKHAIHGIELFESPKSHHVKWVATHCGGQVLCCDFVDKMFPNIAPRNTAILNLSDQPINEDSVLFLWYDQAHVQFDCYKQAEQYSKHYYRHAHVVYPFLAVLCAEAGLTEAFYLTVTL